MTTKNQSMGHLLSENLSSHQEELQELPQTPSSHLLLPALSVRQKAPQEENLVGHNHSPYTILGTFYPSRSPLLLVCRYYPLFLESVLFDNFFSELNISRRISPLRPFSPDSIIDPLKNEGDLLLVGRSTRTLVFFVFQV